jgi:hypothetical protein
LVYLDVLRQIISEFPQVFLIIEALDECWFESARTELMLVLKIMAEWQLPGLHLLMTSRDETTVRNALKGFTSKEDTLCVDYQELPDRRKDISRKNAKK